MKHFLRLITFCCLLAFATGCHTLRITEPKRSVAEQLLLSTASDRAVEGVDLSSLNGKKVYVDEEYFESYDKGYAIGTIRQHISEAGGRLTQTEYNADVIVEIRSGGLGLDTRETLFGIPALAVPIPFAGPVQTPELALYKSQKADSTAKFALFAYDRPSGKHIHSTGSMPGKAHFYHYKFLGFFNWRSTDIPELDPKIRERLPGD